MKKGKKTPVFSIITICKNSEATIARTIESVLNQNYKNYEYIVVDGLSTDRTLEIIKSYENKFGGRLRLISEKDCGIYDAMNKGIRLAKGDIIGIINSDDWYESDALENVMAHLKKEQSAVVYGELRFVKNDREYLILRNSHNFLEEQMIPHPTCFVPSKLYNKYGLYEKKYKYAADYEFMLRLKMLGVKFIPIDKVIANFSMTGVSNRRGDDTYIESLWIQHRYGLINKIEVYRNIARVRIRILLGLSKKTF